MSDITDQPSPVQPQTNDPLDEVLATLDQQLAQEPLPSTAQSPSVSSDPLSLHPQPAPIEPMMPAPSESTIATSTSQPTPAQIVSEPMNTTSTTPLAEEPYLSQPATSNTNDNSSPQPTKQSGFNLKAVVGALVLVVLVGGLALANYAVKLSQNIQPHASTACTPGQIDCSACGGTQGKVCQSNGSYGVCVNAHACGDTSDNCNLSDRTCQDLGYSNDYICSPISNCVLKTSTGTVAFVGCGSNGVLDPTHATTTACQNCFQNYTNNTAGPVYCLNQSTSCGAKITCGAGPTASPTIGCTVCASNPACNSIRDPNNPGENDCYINANGSCSKVGYCGSGTIATSQGVYAYCQDGNGPVYPMAGIPVGLSSTDINFGGSFKSYGIQVTGADGKAMFGDLSQSGSFQANMTVSAGFGFIEPFTAQVGGVWTAVKAPLTHDPYNYYKSLKLSNGQPYSALNPGDTNGTVYQNCKNPQWYHLHTGTGWPYTAGWFCSGTGASDGMYAAANGYVFDIPSYGNGTYGMVFHFSNCTPTSTPTPTPTPTPPASCNTSCAKSSICPAGLICDQTSKQCRNPFCSSNVSCVCPTIAPTPTPTPLPPPICLNATISPSAPTLGSQVTITCGQVAGVNRYNFRYRVRETGLMSILDQLGPNSNLSTPINVTSFGTYDAQCRPCIGSPTATIGLFDPIHPTMYLRNANTTGTADATIGAPTTGKAVTGDWNGDGRYRLGIYNGSSFSIDTGASTYTTFAFGNAGSSYTPIAGDWNGTGKSGVGLYDKTTGQFFLRNSTSTGFADEIFVFGSTGSNLFPLSGDWTGSGKTTVGVFDSSTSTFYLRNSNTTGFADTTFVMSGLNKAHKLLPVSGSWNGSKITSVGVYDQTTATYYLKDSLTSGPADNIFAYGTPEGNANSDWTPITGKWTNLCTPWESLP